MAILPLLIGIVKKNAILMIDFALDAERREGKSPKKAVFQACLLRSRPITMTTGCRGMERWRPRCTTRSTAVADRGPSCGLWSVPAAAAVGTGKECSCIRLLQMGNLDIERWEGSGVPACAAGAAIEQKEKKA
jgi:hypothetical protein